MFCFLHYILIFFFVKYFRKKFNVLKKRDYFLKKKDKRLTKYDQTKFFDLIGKIIFTQLNLAKLIMKIPIQNTKLMFMV
jgi:hypothetical protein